jgi:hypothetical protein
MVTVSLGDGRQSVLPLRMKFRQNWWVDAGGEPVSTTSWYLEA